MDPCPFVRILIGNLALKLSKSTSPCYCKIKFKNFPTQFSPLPICSQETSPIENQIQACFNLKKSEFDKIVEKSSSTKKPFCLKIEIYAGRLGNTTCGLSCGKLLGTLSLPLDLKGLGNRGLVIQSGWVAVHDSKLHLNVRAEPDPRFVFQFDGEPECSPQVFQVNGNVRQAVFTCKFGFRNTCDRNLRSRSSNSEQSTSRSWISSLRPNKDNKPVKERKGWSITIHDLSGSPVATASMVTPFVPSPGTNRVSRSNPGAWLILRPGQGTWKPWGKLEAWLDSHDRLGYKFELLPDTTTGSIDTVKLADSTVSTKVGGKFMVDIHSTGCTPMTSASSSWDFGSGSDSEGSGSWANFFYRGFVMSSTVAGGGRCSKPEVEVGVHHVSCTEDAAAFVALAAAMDLSMDACRLFSGMLRKELRQEDQECCVV